MVVWTALLSSFKGAVTITVFLTWRQQAATVVQKFYIILS